MWRLVAYDVVQPFTAAAAGFPSWGIGNRTERRLGFSYPWSDFTN
jgi:hypothetical protein